MTVNHESKEAYVDTRCLWGFRYRRGIKTLTYRGSITDWIHKTRRHATRLSGRIPCALLIIAILLSAHNVAISQVNPAEIASPQLKSLQTAYLSQLLSMNQAITAQRFPFPLFLSRYVGLDPRQQTGADPRGLEFVLFHDRPILKISGNYNAAFDSALLTQNQRANRIFSEVIVPILQLIPDYFNAQANFPRFGFEISYHVRTGSGSYDYEGREILVVVLDKTDALAFPRARTESARQDILIASEIYLNGKEFGLALGAAHPVGQADLAEIRQGRSQRTNNIVPAVYGTAAGSDKAGLDSVAISGKPAGQPEEGSTKASQTSSVMPAASKSAEIEALQDRLKPKLDALAKEGLSRYHIVDYAPPSLIVFRDRIHLQMTLRNPNPFDKNATSIYRRAEQSFDLFLAPLLKSLLERAPVDRDVAGLDITVLNQFGPDAKDSPEALEFIFPLQPLRQFTEAEITNQDLINQSIVLVNGVRIALDLQR